MSICAVVMLRTRRHYGREIQSVEVAWVRSNGGQVGQRSLNEVHGEKERDSGLRLGWAHWPRGQDKKAERPASHLLAADFGLLVVQHTSRL